jgi:putative chitinase
MNPITDDQLSTLFPDAEDGYLAQVAAELNTNLSAYGLDSPLRCAHFFAQVMQETGAGLEAKTESLNYSPKALGKFSYYAHHPDEASQDGYLRDPKTNEIVRHANEEAIANKAYGGRADLGNGGIASGDGWLFRGRGFIQVTGRANYTALANQYKKIYGAGGADFVTNPDLVATFPYSVRSAICFWTEHGCPKLADAGSSDANVNAITNIVNSSTDSKPQRCANFKKAYAVFQ